MQRAQHVLGVRQGASHKEIRHAYQRWLRLRNPHHEPDNDERWAKTQVRKEVDRAYLQLIRGPERRKRAR